MPVDDLRGWLEDRLGEMAAFTPDEPEPPQPEPPRVGPRKGPPAASEEAGNGGGAAGQPQLPLSGPAGGAAAFWMDGHPPPSRGLGAVALAIAEILPRPRATSEPDYNLRKPGGD